MGSITIHSDLTGGQNILNSLSYVKKLMENKVILLIGKLSFISVFEKVYWLLEEQPVIWACAVLCQTETEDRKLQKIIYFKIKNH